MKKKAQCVIIAGDIHGDWFKLNQFIDSHVRRNESLRELAREYEVEVLMLQCGDFGYWPHILPREFYGEGIDFDNPPGPAKNYVVKNGDIDFLKDQSVKIYWADGNHENHDALDALERDSGGRRFIPVSPHVYFATFGSVLTLVDGTTVMFCGGADSIDKGMRVAGETWWEQEQVDEKDMMNLPDPATTRIDWVISHTGPGSFSMGHDREGDIQTFDPSREHLEKVRQMFRPKRWYFGHFHEHRKDVFEGCEWMCLDYPGHVGPWWVSWNITEDGVMEPEDT